MCQSEIYLVHVELEQEVDCSGRERGKLNV